MWWFPDHCHLLATPLLFCRRLVPLVLPSAPRVMRDIANVSVTAMLLYVARSIYKRLLVVSVLDHLYFCTRSVSKTLWLETVDRYQQTLFQQTFLNMVSVLS